jgi:alcohol dehydrogenase class IV
MSDFTHPDLDVPAFDYDPRTRVVFGAGIIDRLGEFARKLNGQRVLLVSDQGLREAGHEAHGVRSLRDEGLHVVIYDDVLPNPTTENVERGADFARQRQIDLIVGLGGGSSIDCAKGINFLLTNGGRMEDYWGIGKAKQPMLPLIAVPTTAGTGSEAQSFAVIAHPETHIKMACGDRKAAARVAILDPELTVSMPAAVTCATGVDAISHAVETYVTTRRNPVSQLFSRQAWSLLAGAFPRVVANPEDVPARGAMLLGAHLAGAAIENSMLGATHASANPLTAHYGVTHGVAIGIMLPHVVRFNGLDGVDVRSLYGHFAADLNLCAADDPDAPQRLADLLREMTRRTGMPTSLSECGVEAGLIPTLAQEAAEQWTGKFNPRPVQASQFEELYRCALHDDGG